MFKPSNGWNMSPIIYIPILINTRVLSIIIKIWTKHEKPSLIFLERLLFENLCSINFQNR